MDVRLMEKAKEGDPLFLLYITCPQVGEGKISFVKVLSGESTVMGAIGIYSSTREYLADKGAVEVTVRLLGRPASEVLKSFWEYLQTFEVDALNDLLYSHSTEFFQGL